MNFDESIEQIKQGFEGEKIVREFLKKQNYPFMQIDVFFENKKNGKLYVGEVKAQEKFTKKLPDYPFDAHGLPPWQIKARLKLCERIGARAVFFVYDTQDKIVYWQFLDLLNNLPPTKKMLTKTGKRVLFDIESFNKITNL